MAGGLMDTAREFNRFAQDEYPLTSAVLQMHPAIGIPSAAMNYADAWDEGDQEKAIKSAISAIPVAERAYHVGTKLASKAGDLVSAGASAWQKATGIGRKVAAGEQTAEALEAGYSSGNNWLSHFHNAVADLMK